MIQDAFRRPSWRAPGVDSYNALLAGMVRSLGRSSSSSGAQAAPAMDATESTLMESTFGKLREEMLRCEFCHSEILSSFPYTPSLAG